MIFIVYSVFSFSPNPCMLHELPTQFSNVLKQRTHRFEITWVHPLLIKNGYQMSDSIS